MRSSELMVLEGEGQRGRPGMGTAGCREGRGCRGVPGIGTWGAVGGGNGSKTREPRTQGLTLGASLTPNMGPKRKIG